MTCGTIGGRMAHQRRKETPCAACKAAAAAYSRHWYRYGAAEKWGIAERIVDVTATYGAVDISEFSVLLPDVKTNSVRRTVYRLLKDGRLRRLVGGFVVDVGDMSRG